mgnify:CR=1 FL=1
MNQIGQQFYQLAIDNSYYINAKYFLVDSMEYKINLTSNQCFFWDTYPHFFEEMWIRQKEMSIRIHFF